MAAGIEEMIPAVIVLAQTFRNRRIVSQCIGFHSEPALIGKHRISFHRAVNFLADGSDRLRRFGI